jgi:predicted NodU family carbamoyl transferase|tara:strand:+ start:51 stop:1484 length:1434 start_codon:yes stop_codon:yes gene_type:complete
MYILSIHLGHDGAFSISKNKELLVHCQLDRFNRIKHSPDFSGSFLYYLHSLKIKFDKILLTDLYDFENSIDKEYFKILFKNFNLINKDSEIISFDNHQNRQHHLFHAYCSKATLGSNKNYVIIDGAGSYKKELGKHERESIFDENFKIKNQTYECIGGEYGLVTANLLNTTYKYAFSQCGKTMALSQYGTKTIEINKKINLTSNKNDKQSQDYLFSFQKEIEKKIINSMPIENVNYSGGVAQNILANSYFLKYKNFKIDPICIDSGTSLGLLNYYLKGELQKLNNVYLGPKPDYDYLSIFKDYEIVDSDENKVSKILKDNPVALFQGKSEQGQRGLGNRSLLINPDNKNAVEKINDIKKREWYRPFSPSVIEEKAFEYFDIDKNFNSPYMLYAFKSKSFLKNVSAIDGSSRIQTVNINQNKNYYKLLKASGDILLNTSLNFSGQVLVENLFDLKFMMENSTLKYSWLPDINKLIKKK